jgi:hypothetical protein
MTDAGQLIGDAAFSGACLTAHEAIEPLGQRARTLGMYEIHQASPADGREISPKRTLSASISGMNIFYTCP